LEFNVPFQHKYGYIRDECKIETETKRKLYVAYRMTPTAVTFRDLEGDFWYLKSY